MSLWVFSLKGLLEKELPRRCRFVPDAILDHGCPWWTRLWWLCCLWAGRYWGPWQRLNRTYGTRTSSRLGRYNGTMSSADGLNLHRMHCFPQCTCRNQLQKHWTFQDRHGKQGSLVTLAHWELPPVVWSWSGPVRSDGVGPEFLVQSKLSWISWCHPHRLSSKLQFMGQTMDKQIPTTES